MQRLSMLIMVAGAFSGVRCWDEADDAAARAASVGAVDDSTAKAAADLKELQEDNSEEEQAHKAAAHASHVVVMDCT